MATHHAVSGEVVNLARWADDLAEEHSKVIMRSEALELARLVIPRGTTMHPHRPCRVAGAVVIHCLDGAIRLRVAGRDATVRAGELVHLEGGVEHEISALEDALVLLTITFPPPAAG